MRCQLRCTCQLRTEDTTQSTQTRSPRCRCPFRSRSIPIVLADPGTCRQGRGRRESCAQCRWPRCPPHRGCTMVCRSRCCRNPVRNRCSFARRWHQKWATRCRSDTLRTHRSPWSWRTFRVSRVYTWMHLTRARTFRWRTRYSGWTLPSANTCRLDSWRTPATRHPRSDPRCNLRRQWRRTQNRCPPRNWHNSQNP